MLQVTTPSGAGQSRHFYRPADLSGVAVALFEDGAGHQARLGAYLREAGARVCPVLPGSDPLIRFRAIALSDVIVVNQRDPEAVACQARSSGRPIIFWGRPRPWSATHTGHVVAPEVGPERLASAVLLRAAVWGAGLVRPDDVPPDELLPRLRTMARLLVHDTLAADDILQVALERGLENASDPTPQSPLGRRLVGLVELIWQEQKLSRLN